MEMQNAPLELMDKHGKPIYGQFDKVLRSLAIERFDYRNAMDGKVATWGRYFHYKQFQFVSVVTRQYILGIAVADIRYLRSAFFYLYDIHSNELTEQKWLRPLSLGGKMTASPYQGETYIAGRAISFVIEQGRWRVKLNTESVEADIELTPTEVNQPLAMCTPTGYSGWTYTQKHNTLSVSGQLMVHKKSVDLQRALASYDFSAGYMRKETSWRWANFNTWLGGTRLGLNLAAGVNETGSCENALWIDGVQHKLGPVHFSFDRQDSDQIWRIFSSDGQLNLTFTINNRRTEKLNFILLKSNFRQFIGRFSGTIKDNHGRLHKLDNVVGLTEDHFARW